MKIRNFKHFCVTIGNLPASYVDSMSYYELLMWFCKFLNETVIPAINDNAEAVKEIQEWLDNLDVQEEINKKLDSMAESGELTELISTYLNLKSQLMYDTIEDMKQATNLQNGSYAKTLGKNIYFDGLGSEYKIRNKKTTDIIDNDKIIQLNNINLVAEKINTIDVELSSNLTLQKNITFDSTVGGYIQGMTSNGSKIYVYRNSNTNLSGEILVFNYLTMELENTINNVIGYHGNDIAFLNGKLYFATFKNASNSLTKISIYDLVSNTTTEIDPLSSLGYDHIWGIAKYDDNHLICALTNQTTAGNVNFELDKFVLLNVNDNTYTELNFENTIRTSGFYARQSIEYKNNKLYILTSLNDAIIECNISNNNIIPSKIYNLPRYDMDNNPVNEYQGIAIADDNQENSLIISTIVTKPNNLPTYKFYCINTKYNLPEYFFSKIYTDNSAQIPTIYVGASNVNYEDGSVTYPYKDLSRALHKVKGHEANIVIKDGGTYYASFIENVKVKITTNVSETINIVCANYVNSDIEIIGNTDSKNINFTSNDGNITFENSKLFARFCTFNRMTAINNSEIFVSDCNKIGNSDSILVANRSTVKVKSINKIGTVSATDIIINNNSIAYKGELNVIRQDGTGYIFSMN